MPLLRVVIDDQAEDDLAALAAELSLTRSGVVRLALRQLRRSQVASPPLSPEDIAQQRRSRGRRGPRPSRAAQRDRAAGASAEEA